MKSTTLLKHALESETLVEATEKIINKIMANCKASCAGKNGDLLDILLIMIDKMICTITENEETKDSIINFLLENQEIISKYTNLCLFQLLYGRIELTVEQSLKLIRTYKSKKQIKFSLGQIGELLKEKPKVVLNQLIDRNLINKDDMKMVFKMNNFGK